MTAPEYASACGDWVQANVGPDESDFVKWVSGAMVLQPPTELEDFHRAMTGQYLLQLDTSAQPPTVIGPNDDTQFWYDMELEVVAAMPSSMAQILEAGGCLQEGDVELAKGTMAAMDRMTQEGFFEPNTVDAYLQVCTDITMTRPIMNTMDAIYEHIIGFWSEITPPTGIQDYHVAVLRLYLHLEEAGDLTNVDPSIIQDVNNEAANLGDAFVGKLLLSGCVG